MATKPKIAVIATDWNTNEYREKHNLYGGVGYYRVFKPYTELKNRGWKIDLYNKEFKDLSEKYKTAEDFWVDFVSKYDIIITKAVDNPTAASAACFFAHHFGKKILLDLDDNYFEVNPENVAAYQAYHPGSKKRAYLAAYMSEVDGIICSTEPLARYYNETLKKIFNKDIPCYVFPNFNDYKEWPSPAPLDNNFITIGWAGSVTHDADLRLVMPALSRLMSEYKDLRIELTGGLTPETAPKILQFFEENVSDRISMTGGTNAWNGYPELLMSKKWDIGIAPLINEEFNRGKSHIKWMEYAMAKIPCVASKVYPYYKNIGELDTIIDSKTGLLAIDGLDFYRKLKFLIDNKKKRVEIGAAAYEQVKNNWQWGPNINKLEEILNKIYEPIKN